MNDQPECTDYAVAGHKFGTASCHFDGVADYLIIPDDGFGGDFSVEFRVRRECGRMIIDGMRTNHETT